MRVLVGCETSGVVRDAFRALGHDAWSCDLEPSDTGSPFHIQGDVRDIMHDFDWDLGIFHPPCQYLSSSGLHWNNRGRGWQNTKEAAMLFLACYESTIPMVCVENPVGHMNTAFRKPDQYVQPYEFGDDASKKTALWLRGLPPLVKDQSKRVNGRLVTMPNGKLVERWSNQTDSGQNKLGPSADRAKIRSKTYNGIAQQMALQWSKLI
jgi:hypothetical protein